MASNAAPLSHFTLKLYNQMAAGKSENFFISPFSISTALAMCQVGARNETAQQLKKLLSVDHLSDADFLALNNDYLTTVNSGLGQNVKINTANKIYPHNKFQINKEFTDLLSKHFQSEVELVNYGDAQASANTINTWVANKTGQKIKDLIDASVLNDLTRLVLVNAIYFKGDWKTKFQPDQTTKETFYMSAESSKQVDMMKLFNKKFNYLYSPGGLSCGALELPYVGDSIAMTIILPNEGTYVEEIEKKLTPEILHEILTGFLPTETVNLQLPKFKLEYKQELSDHMKALGAVLPFDEAKADFTGATKEPTGLYISAVIHQAVVEVNEEGSEAAAATGVVMMTRAMRLPGAPIDFNCNRPFLFVIHDKTKHAVLFYGKYAKAI